MSAPSKKSAKYLMISMRATLVSQALKNVAWLAGLICFLFSVF
jgi:hypothetical protein